MAKGLRKTSLALRKALEARTKAQRALDKAREAYATARGNTPRVDTIEQAEADVYEARKALEDVCERYSAIGTRLVIILSDLRDETRSRESLVKDIESLIAESAAADSECEDRKESLLQAFEAFECGCDDEADAREGTLTAALELARAVQAPRLRPSTWQTLEEQAATLESEIIDALE